MGPRQNVEEPACLIGIDGIDLSKLELGIRQVTVDLNLTTFGSFYIVLSGSGTNSQDFAWINSDLFAVGKSVSIWMGVSPGSMTRMISGRISNVAAEFSPTGPPSVEISGDDSETFSMSKKRRRPAIIKRYGMELLSFNADMGKDSRTILELGEVLANRGIGSLSATKNQRHMSSRRVLEDLEEEKIVGVGECVGDPIMVPGRTLRLQGLGDWLSRSYLVNGTVHAFDPSGYRTTFMVATR